MCLWLIVLSWNWIKKCFFYLLHKQRSVSFFVWHILRIGIIYKLPCTFYKTCINCTALTLLLILTLVPTSTPHCKNKVIGLTHIRLPLLQPQYQRMCHYEQCNKTLLLRKPGFFGGDRNRLVQDMHLQIVLIGLTLLLKLDKWGSKVIHLFTHYFVTTNEIALAGLILQCRPNHA